VHDTDKLPLVHVTVLYHGEGEYRHSTKISDYIAASPELSQDNLHSQLQLVDLNTIPDEQLRQHFLAGALQHALKHIRAANIVEMLKGFSSWLADLEAEHGDFVQDLVQYLIEAGQFSDPEALKQVIQQELPKTGDKMNNLLKYERQKGMQQGMQQVAKNLLEEHESVEKIARVTGLDQEIIRSFKADKNDEDE